MNKGPHGVLVVELVNSGLTAGPFVATEGLARCQRGCLNGGGVLAPASLVGWLPLTNRPLHENWR